MLAALFAVLAAASNAGSSVLQRKANVEEAATNSGPLAGLLHLARRPPWLAGMALVLASFGLQAAALNYGELAEVQPLLSLELPLTLMIASIVFRRRLPLRTWLELGMMSAGIALFLLALHPAGGEPGRTSGAEWAMGGGATGFVIVLLAVGSYFSRGQRRAALLGVASGVAFALTATFMAGALADGFTVAIFTHWQWYLLLLTGLSAMLLLQEGFRAGTLVAVQPGVVLSDPVVSVILGAMLFGDDDRYGVWLIPEVIGALAVGWGAVQLSRSPLAADAQGLPAEDDGSGMSGADGRAAGTQSVPHSAPSVGGNTGASV